jgi:hypothetical protein
VSATTQLESPALPDQSAAPARSDQDRADGHPRRARRGRGADLVIAVCALSPFVVGVCSIIRRGFPDGALFGDRALLALSAGDAWRAPVLLGPYSRFYWHHPGPLYFYVLNVVSPIFGGRTVGLVLAATAINVGAAGGLLLLAHRRGGRALLVWASLLLTAYMVVIEPTPFDIWNPSVTLLPFVLILVLAWSLGCGDWWTAPWLVLVGSFAVQTHVGLIPGVATALLFACFAGVWRVRRQGSVIGEAERRSIRRCLLASLVVGIVVWLPPVIEQFTTREGNLTLLFRFFTRPGSPHTFADGLTTTALQTSLLLRGVFEPVSLRADAHQGLAPAIVITTIAFAAAVVLAKRARGADSLALVLLVVVEVVVSVEAVTRIAGPISFYLVQWISAVGFVLWLAVGSSVLDFARARPATGTRTRALVRVGAILVLGALCASTIRAIPVGAGRVNEDLDVPNDRALFGDVPTSALLASTRRGQRVALRLDSVTGWEVMAADALLLVQHGRRVEVVDSPVTRLLFDDAIRVPAASGSKILAFRDRPHPKLGVDATLVADQGEWAIVAIGHTPER